MSPEASLSNRARGARAAVPPALRSVMLVGPLPPPSGGMANQTRQLAELLRAEGCRVTLVQTNSAYRPARIAQWRGVRALFRLLPFVVRLWRAAGDADLAHVMANSGWAWHLFAAPAVWIASWRGVPTIVNYRGGDADAFLAREIAWVRPTLARAAGIVVPSEFLAGVFARRGVAATIVPNVVNLEAFARAAQRPPAPHVIVTRNLEPIYDIGTALRAFAIVREKHPDARMTVAGSGPAREELETLARTLGLGAAVTFTGRIDNVALPALYQSASVLVNASRIDNMPISLLEAMASGVPIVSTRAGGIPFMIDDGITGMLVEPGDHVAMAAAVNALLADPRRAAALADAACARAGDYAWSRVRPRLLDVYARARGGRAEPASP